MIDPGARKPIARRQSGLPAADDDSAVTALDLLLRAHLAPPSRKVSQATRASSCPSNCVAVASMRASWPSASEHGWPYFASTRSEAICSASRLRLQEVRDGIALALAKKIPDDERGGVAALPPAVGPADDEAHLRHGRAPANGDRPADGAQRRLASQTVRRRQVRAREDGLQRPGAAIGAWPLRSMTNRPDRTRARRTDRDNRQRERSAKRRPAFRWPSPRARRGRSLP